MCVRERDWDLNSGDAPWNAAEKTPVSSAKLCRGCSPVAVIWIILSPIRNLAAGFDSWVMIRWEWKQVWSFLRWKSSNFRNLERAKLKLYVYERRLLLDGLLDDRQLTFTFLSFMIWWSNFKIRFTYDCCYTDYFFQWEI